MLGPTMNTPLTRMSIRRNRQRISARHFRLIPNWTSKRHKKPMRLSTKVQSSSPYVLGMNISVRSAAMTIFPKPVNRTVQFGASAVPTRGTWRTTTTRTALCVIPMKSLHFGTAKAFMKETRLHSTAVPAGVQAFLGSSPN